MALLSAYIVPPPAQMSRTIYLWVCSYWARPAKLGGGLASRRMNMFAIAVSLAPSIHGVVSQQSRRARAVFSSSLLPRACPHAGA